ncbi:YkgJ family cysteine cluster protein [Spirosoma aerophilum]
MIDLNAHIPIEEQEICVTCGFCCDGTLFKRAILEPGEQGNLPEKIEELYGKESESEFFNLPCPYFCEKCTIYEQKRASICGAFRCQLLKNMAKDTVTNDKALRIVANAKQLRAEIMQLYTALTGLVYVGGFMQFLDEIYTLKQTTASDPLKNGQFNLLVMKCGILDALLTKTFKSPKSFDALLKESMNQL